MGILLWRKEEDEHFDRNFRAIAHLHMTSVAYKRANNPAWSAARIAGFLLYRARIVDSPINYSLEDNRIRSHCQKTIYYNTPISHTKIKALKSSDFRVTHSIIPADELLNKKCCISDLLLHQLNE